MCIRDRPVSFRATYQVISETIDPSAQPITLRLVLKPAVIVRKHTILDRQHSERAYTIRLLPRRREGLMMHLANVNDMRWC